MFITDDIYLLTADLHFVARIKTLLIFYMCWLSTVQLSAFLYDPEFYLFNTLQYFINIL